MQTESKNIPTSWRQVLESYLFLFRFLRNEWHECRETYGDWRWSIKDFSSRLDYWLENVEALEEHGLQKAAEKIAQTP